MSFSLASAAVWRLIPERGTLGGGGQEIVGRKRDLPSPREGISICLQVVLREES
jgi:hypothetical protein